MTRIAGVILAAGRSVRLGRPKQLLPLAGEPMIRHVARVALASKLDDVLIVAGYVAEQVRAAVQDLEVRVVVNPDFEQGQSTSVIAGVRALSADIDAVVFLLGDQPELDQSVIDPLVTAHRSGGAPICQAAYGGVGANPVLFARTLFPELIALTGDEGARSIIRAHRAHVELVPVAPAYPPRDIDTNEDYAALLQRWAVRSFL